MLELRRSHRAGENRAQLATSAVAGAHMADDIAEAQLREAEDKEAAMMKAVRPLHAPCFVTRRALADLHCRPTLYPRL
jgi:hypothetical protein